MKDFYNLPVWNAGQECPKSFQALKEFLCESYNERCEIITKFFASITAERRLKLESEILPKILDQASKLRDLFPDGKLKRLIPEVSDSILLSRKQICAVLAHMFLGTTKPDDHIRFYANFAPWLAFNAEFCGKEDPRFAYVNSLFFYFEKFFCDLQENEKNEIVTFYRLFLANPPNWTVDFVEKFVHAENIDFSLDGKIGELPGKEIEMDFANKDVGFGATGTQEEILFGCSPELCIVPLLAPTLGHTEVLKVTGAMQICTSNEYGNSVTVAPCTVEYCSNRRTVICVDAQDYSDIVILQAGQKKFAYGDIQFLNEEEFLRLQLSDNHVLRDLNKLFIAFSNCPDDMQIATGKWGCGAFTGIPLIKCSLQIVAAAACGKKLKFYLFNDEELLKTLRKILILFCGKSVGDCVEFLQTDADFASLIKL